MGFKMLIIDDHAVLRAGIRSVLADWDDCNEIIEADNACDAITISQNNPDLGLILLDLGLPDVDGFELLEKLVNDFPGVPVVIFSVIEQASVIDTVLHKGAKGYIPKSSPFNIIESALRLVLSGGIYLPPTLLDLTGENSGIVDRKVTNSTVSGSDCRPLTKRQYDIVQHLVEGKTNKEIGYELNMSPATVRSHLTIIFRQLNVKNRTEAVNVVRNKGMFNLVAH